MTWCHVTRWSRAGVWVRTSRDQASKSRGGVRYREFSRIMITSGRQSDENAVRNVRTGLVDYFCFSVKTSDLIRSIGRFGFHWYHYKGMITIICILYHYITKLSIFFAYVEVKNWILKRKLKTSKETNLFSINNQYFF